MTVSPKSQASSSHIRRIPFYFAARPRRLSTPRPASPSETLELQQEEDLRAEDLKPARLRKLQQDLDLFNASGRIVTYDKIIGDWVTWNRPRRVLKNKTVPVAACGFYKVKGFVRPLCPHAHNEFRTDESCRMDCYRETVNRKERWVFRARKHDCSFTVVIPSLASKTEYVLEPENDDIETNSMPLSAASHTGTSSVINTERNVSCSSSSMTSSVRHTSSQSTAASATSPSSVTSHNSPSGQLDNFRDFETILRRTSEVEAFLTTQSATRNHPAADRDLPPPALVSYHPISQPRPFMHLEFANSMIGRSIQAFNSDEGISTDAWHLLSTSTILCPGCRMMFSIDGFRAHLHNGNCPKPGARFSMAPSHIPCHPAANNNKPPPALVQYHQSSNPPSLPNYFGSSMIGRAFLEWNSVVGIPLDAWYTLATAWVYCTGCQRVRSFDGDCLHRDVNGRPFCGGRRLGLGEDDDDELPVFGKGKERAI